MFRLTLMEGGIGPVTYWEELISDKERARNGYEADVVIVVGAML